MGKNTVNIVGYKGGDFKKCLYQRLGVRCLNIEHFGCPKYEKLCSRYQVAKLCCDYHNFLNNIHCSKYEVLWFSTYT